MAQRRGREFDEATAHAVSLMTLCIGATSDCDVRAGALLEELLAVTDGAEQTVGGFQTLCGVLLILLELETGAAPAAVLQRIGAMIATDGCLLR